MNGHEKPAQGTPPQGALTAEQHLQAALQELRSARSSFQKRLRPTNLIQSHPWIAGALAVGATFLAAKVLRGKRSPRRKREDSDSSASDSIGGTFARSFMMGTARQAGKWLPGLALYWLARRKGVGSFGFGRGRRSEFDGSSRRR